MFVTVEGGDGAGKSTLIEHLVPHFDLITREPGGCELAETIRKWLLHSPTCPEAETLLFLAARAQHINEVIEPALKAGKSVLCDRFNDSTIAYQGYGRQLGRERVETLCNLACPLKPDLSIYIDLDPKIALARLKGLDRIEQEELAFHERVREGFLALDHLHVIDGSLSPEEVARQAEALLCSC